MNPVVAEESLINGKFKLKENIGYDNFLAFQGAPWLIRKAILLEKPTVSIIMEATSTVEVKQVGLIRQHLKLNIGAKPVENVMRIAKVSFSRSLKFLIELLTTLSCLHFFFFLHRKNSSILLKLLKTDLSWFVLILNQKMLL